MPTDAPAPAPPICANIGPAERRKRLEFGLWALGMSAAIAILLVATGIPAALRVVVFLPLWAAGLGFFQWRDKT